MNNKILIILRYILTIIAGLFISQMLPLGVSFWFVLFSMCFGLAGSDYVLRKEISLKNISLFHVLIIAALEALFFITTNLLPVNSNYPILDLYPDIVHSQVSLLIAIYLFLFIENYLFWTKPSFWILEIFFSGSILIFLLGAHRNYNIDMPNELSSLTWKHPLFQNLMIEPQQLIISIGFIIAILSIIYALLSANRKTYHSKEIIIQKNKPQILLTSIFTIFLSFLIGYSAHIILSRYNAELFQIMNGVGPSNEINSGESNLGFNEASQPSNQAAALVRLLNSYEENPWEGMLYFREGALSGFNGREMVKAPSEFDTDAPIINPTERTSLKILGEPKLRKPLKQAVYVLSDKISPFAIDSATEFVPIKNPSPKRFRYSYTVQSLVLKESIDSLKKEDTGNPNWTKDVWKFYLRAPGSNDTLEFESLKTSDIDYDKEILSSNNEDLRYLALSKEITKDASSNMEKVFSIIDYLSKESIYVLKPGHLLGQRGDPVAPYLFPERKRGYCVHFAHAAVYLLRLAGIPSRIGTGFLVDLQYAKGGDILVQMGDRHAWPEVFIKDRGWIAIDVNPAEAENDQVAIPDESLLEQLMSEIDPIEELLGEDSKIETQKDKKSPIEEFLDSKLFSLVPLYILGGILLILILIKVFMRHAWRFSSAPTKKIRFKYLSTISILEDIGEGRNFGETRLQYGKRLNLKTDNNFFNLTDTYIKSLNHKDINDFYNSKISSKFFGITYLEKIILFISYLNPSSLKYLKHYFIKSTLLLLLLLFQALNPYSSFAIPQIDYDDSDYELFDSSEESNSKSPDQILKEGILLYQTGRGIDARAKFEELLRISPNDYRPYFHLGQYYLVDVGHFKLSYRYLKKARELFENKYTIMGAEFISNFQLQNEYSLILYFNAEAALNLDFYEESLEILEEYTELFQSPWLPGQKAWVLMKLKRVDEAIKVAKQGLLAGADPKRTWNILGILLSISGERELSIEAFSRAVDYEFTARGNSQAATPLNNSGEVYRELFKDDLAESAWRTALKLPDGCEHILPSINLSILYTDQLRVFQALQVLSDFEACYAKRPERKDTEHRTILALARGKLHILLNKSKEAIKLLERAAYDQQWFGKIGTNENDVKFAAWKSLAIAYLLEAESLIETKDNSIIENLKNRLLNYKFRISSWWLNRSAKLFAVNELDDFEDLLIRHTDTMITYPFLGYMLSEFDTKSLKRRVERLLENDKRSNSHPYYLHFLAKNYFKNSRKSTSLELANEIQDKFPTHERLIIAENLSLILKAKTSTYFWWRKSSLLNENIDLVSKLYRTSPVHLKLHNIPLPVQLDIEEGVDKDVKNEIKRQLSNRRFIFTSEGLTPFRVLVSKSAGSNYHLQLYDTEKNIKLHSSEINNDTLLSIRDFIEKSFSHREDPVSAYPPPVPFMKKYGNF